MTKSEFLESPRGQHSRYVWRKWRSGRLLRLGLDHEPKSKKMPMKERVIFQRDVASQLKQMKRAAFRGLIAAKFIISPTSKSPPHPQSIMKNLLDLLHKQYPGSGVSKSELPFYDDSQIKYLSVVYSLRHSSPKIEATFAPMDFFLKDLSFANQILCNDFGDFSDDYKKVLNEIGESRDYDYSRYQEEEQFDEELEELRALRNREGIYSEIDEDYYQSMSRFYAFRVQDYLLKGFRLSIRDIFYFYRAAGFAKPFSRHSFSDVDKRLQELAQHMCDFTKRLPVRINLPQIPSQDGETPTFEAEVKRIMGAFSKRYSILQELQIPIGLEVIYKPPYTSADFSKDLDNIMREYILPPFNEYFKPPVEYLANLDITKVKEEWMKGRINAIPKSVRFSISRYDIMEVPRLPNDTTDGYLCIGFSGHMFPEYSSIWDRIDTIIDKWYDDPGHQRQWD